MVSTWLTGASHLADDAQRSSYGFMLTMAQSVVPYLTSSKANRINMLKCQAAKCCGKVGTNHRGSHFQGFTEEIVHPIAVVEKLNPVIIPQALP